MIRSMPRRGHGEGTIRHRADRDLWEARYTDGDGRRQSLYAPTRRVVQTKLNAVRHALARFDEALVLRRLSVSQGVDPPGRPLEHALLMQADQVLARDTVGGQVPRPEYSVPADEGQNSVGLFLGHALQIIGN